MVLVTVQAADHTTDLAQHRLEALFDRKSMHLGDGLNDGVRVACGRIDGTSAMAYATAPTVRGGALGVADCRAIVQAIDAATQKRLPVIGLWQSGGARLDQGVAALDAIGSVFAAIVRASGRIPQISVVLGPAAGGAAYGPALTDIVIMSDAGRIFVTGPDVVREVTGEDVDMRRLGGPEPHGRRSGLVHVVTGDEAAALSAARTLAALLGRPGRLDPEAVPDVDLSRHERNARPLVDALLDEPGTELHGRWAPNVMTVIGRFGGRTVGVVANNPTRLGGCLDAAGADKAARFVQMCDGLGVPLIVVVDVPGQLPGVGQEWGAIARRGAKLIHAFAAATVPRVTLVTRRAYGSPSIIFNSRALGASAVFAWPDAEIAPLVANGGLIRALDAGVVDEIVSPAETRSRIARALAAAPPARRSRANIPL